MHTIGIVAHSAEGGALCFTTVCREGQRVLGPHVHPEVVLSAVPMGRSMEAWAQGDLPAVGRHLRRGIDQVAAAGARFFVCPDNTAHIALEPMADTWPLPGLHIAEVVCDEIEAHCWRRVAVLGTSWTMNGPVYARALAARGLEQMLPRPEHQHMIHQAIFDELCQGQFRAETTQRFIAVIAALASAGAECVVLGCTEIPLIIGPSNSPLPVLDSTRLLAARAVSLALAGTPLPRTGWIPLAQP